jgi:hypothetical protein
MNPNVTPELLVQVQECIGSHTFLDDSDGWAGLVQMTEQKHGVKDPALIKEGVKDLEAQGRIRRGDLFGR